MENIIQAQYLVLARLTLQHCLSHWGERLISFVVYGSVARGTATLQSDLDLLLVVRPNAESQMTPRVEFRKIESQTLSDFTSRNTEGINAYISPIIKSVESCQAGSPLFFDLVEDALILHDKQRFFAGVLEKLQKRMCELGSRRVWIGEAWYWDLKPNYQVGEVIEI
jgi:uncharacterized protein